MLILLPGFNCSWRGKRAGVNEEGGCCQVSGRLGVDVSCGDGVVGEGGRSPFGLHRFLPRLSPEKESEGSASCQLPLLL